MSDDAKSRPVKDLKESDKEAEKVKGGYSPVDGKLPPRPYSPVDGVALPKPISPVDG